MRFDLINTNFPDFLEYMLLFFAAGGHSAEIVPRPRDNVQSVFIERFKANDIETLRKLKEAGRPAIIISTEFVTGATFNDFTRDGACGTHYSDRELWQWRYDGFKSAAQYARAIWNVCAYPEQLNLYRELAGDVPVCVLPFPCLPNYRRVEHRPKDIDLFFWGNPSPYRKAIEEAVSHGRKAVFGSNLSNAQRDDYTARSKVVLALRLAPYWPYSSATRYWYHLSNGSAIVADRCPWPSPYDACIGRIVDTDQLGAACDELLAGDAWEAVGRESYERFASEHPGAEAVNELVERTYSSGV